MPQQEPQSWGQVLQLSNPLQAPSPQAGQTPQSWAQVEHDSPLPASQTVSPQTAQAPQSPGQEPQLSPSCASQAPLPQQEPQSWPQE